MPTGVESDTEALADLDSGAHGVTWAQTHEPLQQTMRGDFEAGNAVVIGIAGSYVSTLEPLLRTLAGRVPVEILVQRDDASEDLRNWLDELDWGARAAVDIIEYPVDSPWVRDYGPLQLRDQRGRPVWLDGQYRGRPRDDAAPGVLAGLWGAKMQSVPWSIEGGALASNGAGLCVTTSDYVRLHELPVALQADVDTMLPTIGCRVLVMVPALPDEDTRHVDLFVQFLSPNLVAVASFDPDLDFLAAARLDETARGILAYAALSGVNMGVVRVPISVDEYGDYMSYLNGLRVGSAFLMPSYHDRPSPIESSARRLLEAASPGLEVIRIPAREMLDLGGAIHCVTLAVHGDMRTRARARARDLRVWPHPGPACWKDCIRPAKVVRKRVRGRRSRA